MRTRSFFAMAVLGLAAVSCSVPPPASTTPSPAGNINAILGRGMDFLQQGQTGPAVEEFSKAVILDPASAKPRNFLGMAYFKKKDYARAAEQFQKAIELDSKFASAHNNLGGALLMLEKYDEAAAQYARAIALDPKNVSAHFSLGSLLLLRQRQEDGLKHLTLALELDPDYLERNAALVSSLTSRSSGEMMFDYAKAFASAGNVVQSVFYLGRAKAMGFKDWRRILSDKEFEAVRQDSKIQEFIKL